jgi:hypothetical protein
MERDPVARPKKVIDPEKVETLAGMGLSCELIAAVLGVNHHTIERRFAPILFYSIQRHKTRHSCSGKYGLGQGDHRTS